MDCILLGTGGMMPMPHRLLTSLVVRLNGRIYAFDAGEGAQLGWKGARLGLRGFDLLAVTHLHADHCLGIPGLLMLRAQMDDPGPLTILGPPGIDSFLKGTREALGFHLDYPLQIVEWSDSGESLAYEDSQVRILWEPLKHSRFCLGYRLEELDRPGKFHPERAARLGIPRGPLWAQLQNGRDVIMESGATISPQQVLGPTRRGRRIAFVVDTRPTKTVYKLCGGVDLAFLEGMFLAQDADHAEAKGHLTGVEAARMARRAGARRAVLVHLSPRYGEEELIRLEAEVTEVFTETSVGKDLGVYSVPYEDN